MDIRRGLPEICTSYHPAIRIELETVIDSSPPVLSGMLRYHMGWQDENGCDSTVESGKLIRPSLCLLSCRAAGGDTSQAMPAAAAVELVHNFSLIHDDIEDCSRERHHRPALWTLWGTPQAINAGDAMFALAYLALLRLSERGINNEKIARSADILSQACLELCEGQCLDIQFETRLDNSVEDYLDMAGKKTAALLAASASLGAHLGGGDDSMVDSFHLFGRELGMAFQIRDDIIGIWGTEDNTGKPASDIPNRKKTLPVVYGLRHAADVHRERLQQLYRQEFIGAPDTDEVKTILEAAGARDYAESLAEQHHCQALAALAACGPDSSGTSPLQELARFLLRRDF